MHFSKLLMLIFKVRICILTKQKALGRYNAFIGDEVCIIEPLPFYNNTNQSNSNSNKIISSNDLFEQLRTGAKSSVDEEMYVNARLIDLLQAIGVEIKIIGTGSKFINQTKLFMSQYL